MKHFQTVQTAYLDFSQHLGDIFGTYQERRAHELRLRANKGSRVANSESGAEQHIYGMQHRTTSSVSRKHEERREEPPLHRGHWDTTQHFRQSSQHLSMAQPAASCLTEGTGQAQYRYVVSFYAHTGIPGFTRTPTSYGRVVGSAPEPLYLLPTSGAQGQHPGHRHHHLLPCLPSLP